MRMFALKMFWHCLFSPKLYKVYNGRSGQGKYVESNLERWGDQIITSMFVMWNIGIYTSPVLAYLLYRKGYFMYEGLLSLSKIAVGVGCILMFSYCLRSYGRITNSVYLEFQRTLASASNNLNSDTKKALSRYDFEFSAWPVEFSMKDVQGEHSRKPHTASKRSFASYVLYAPCSAISYLVAHTFGIRLIYPGSVTFVSYLMSNILLKGRTKLVQQSSAERFKLKTTDGNEIDTIFVDNRNKSENGSILVVCSEGNAGFYEIGIMATPLEADFSAVGWNHPGFGGSTGMPFPEQEQNAVDIVIQFCIHRLGFPVDSIVLFGWSIGGYTTSWASMAYPEVKAVVLDATFDDLLPLAIPRMPMTLEPIVKQTVRQHCNLEVASQVCQYPGPILLIRRAEDEVICLQPGDISTNRANPLLIQILRHRYPNLVTPETEGALAQWLSRTGSRQREVMEDYQVNEARCRVDIASYYAFHDKTFPTTLGSDLDTSRKIQMLLYLASEYMKDFNSSHCTQLPENAFTIPQQL